MKKTYKAVLAVALGLANAMTLKASSGYDLTVGFTEGGGNSGGNDLIIDIGAVSSSAYPGATGLSNGETWNFNSSLSGQNLNPAIVSWGIIGDAVYSDGAATQTLWVTTSGNVPPTISDDNDFGQVDEGISAMQTDFSGGESQEGGTPATPAASGFNSWNEQTISGGLGTQFVNAYANPNVSGETSDTLWKVPEGGTPTELGTFTLNSSGVLTFNLYTGSVPVPQIQSKLTTHNSTTTTIYFTTVASHTYTLYYTNSTGLLAPISKWPTNTTTIVGNGNVESLTDTTSTANRFYVVGVH